MSYYSDWKCGAVTDQEYEMLCRQEEAWEVYYDKLVDANMKYWEENFEDAEIEVTVEDNDSV
jgi:trehalose/maltose hydrolase-like predicted phosphorylase